MNLTERVKGILIRPRTEWQTISGETTSIHELYTTYVMILAAIGPVASVIGMAIVGIGLPFAGWFRVPLMTAIVSAVVHYILTLVGVYILAVIIDTLAPTFSAVRSLRQAFKVAAYSFTPGWLAGVFLVIPVLSPLGILGLYGLYLLYVGLPILMKAPQEKSLAYTIAVIIAAIILFVLISYISRTFISYPMLGRPVS